MQQAPTLPAVPRPSGMRPTGRGASLRESLVGYAFAAPYLVLFLVFMAVPLLASLILSFTDFSLGDLVAPLGAPFVGLDNYIRLVHDSTFLTAARNTVAYVVFGVTFTVGLGLLAAVALNKAIGRFRTIFRVGYYLPVVTSIVAIAVIWRFLLDPSYGVVNGLLHTFRVAGPDWLGNPSLVLPTVISMIVWRNLGNTMIIFLAGLQAISLELYEAASIDGATWWQQFRRITLPMLRPTTLFVVVITTIGYLQVFEEPFVMTYSGGSAGPLNRALTPAIYIYQQGFNFFHLGYASAIAYTLFIVIVAITFIQFRALRTLT